MSTAAVVTRVGRELGSICGVDHVTEAPSVRILGCAPAVAVQPGSGEEIAAILRLANEGNLTVVPAGGFTQQQTGKTPGQVDILLYTTRLTEVEHYDPGDLTIGIGAGFTVGQLSSMVAKDGLLFAGDPPSAGSATVGGLLATGFTGPLRHGYGGLRDYCIGVSFVTGDGRHGKGGGRVVKNVAGYDMMKLLIGSEGTLAIITRASFKLFPAPRQTRTFVAEFSTAAQAIDFRNRVLHSPLLPICLELVSPEAALLLPNSHQELSSRAERSGAEGSVVPRDVEPSWCVYLRAAGSDGVLARYRSELGSAIAHEIEGEDERTAWRAVDDFAHNLPARYPDSLLLSFSLPLSDVGRVLDDTATVAEANGLKFAAIGRVGVGHLLVALQVASAAQANFAAAGSALRHRLPHDASVRTLHCPPAYKENVDLRTPTHVESMRVVKRALDPKDILNRGRSLL